MTPAYLDDLTRTKFSKSEPPQGLHMYKDIGCAVATCQEAKTADTVKPLDKRAFPITFRLDDDMGALWQLRGMDRC